MKGGRPNPPSPNSAPIQAAQAASRTVWSPVGEYCDIPEHSNPGLNRANCTGCLWDRIRTLESRVKDLERYIDQAIVHGRVFLDVRKDVREREAME